MDSLAIPAVENRRFPSWLIWTILLGLGFALRLLIIARTEVAARDSIGFVRYALRLENESLFEVIRSAEQPPGYAAAVMLASWPVRAVTGKTNCSTMIFSAQFASALLATLAMIPMVLLGRELGNRLLGWLAAAVFLTLPAWMRLTSDGLSEGTFLFWLATSCWLAARAVNHPSCGRFFIAGLSAGAAYLTRPEGAEIVAATGVTALGMTLVSAYRQPWSKVIYQLSALGVGFLLLMVPYVATTGRITNKNTGKMMLGDPDVDRTGLTPGTISRSHSARLPLAEWWHEPTHAGKSRPLWAAWSIGSEMVQALHYIGGLLALLGFAVWLRLFPMRPANWLLNLLVLGHAILLWRMAITIGYVSERHTLLFVFAACYLIGAALIWLGQWHAWLPGLTLGAMMIFGLPGIVKAMHANRAGHKAAGVWLSTRATEKDEIFDPFGWAEFYAERLKVIPAPANPARSFVILETSDNQHSRLPALPYAKLKAASGQVVYHWPPEKAIDAAKIVVYEVPGPKSVPPKAD